MPLREVFSPASGELTPTAVPASAGARRPAPFSIRLSADERARLEAEAKGAPLGTYIKAKVIGAAPPARMRRSGLSVMDRQALARALALLGQSRFASNLNQLAHLAHIGALPLTADTEAELRDSLRAVRDLRRLLLEALGLKPDRREDAP